MKVLVVGDVHFSQYSSILRRRGKKYSARLENLIESINWAERLSEDNGCSKVIYLGDFFDSSALVGEEITALKEIKWSSVPHTFLCGNHEVYSHDLVFNSANMFVLDNNHVITKPYTEDADGIDFCYLPYIFEEDRKTIKEYFGEKKRKRVIFSHNDIKGFQMGPFLSTDGFEVEDIKSNCDLYLNGHLHNGGLVEKGIINVGNLTGQNFSEDAFKYSHSVIVLDTDDLKCAVYDNPYAFNFYKLDLVQNSDISYINDISQKIKNAVLTIRCCEEDFDYLNHRFNPYSPLDPLLPRNCNVVEARFIVQRKENASVDKTDLIDLSVDHIQKFHDYIIEKFGSDEIVLQELQEVCK